MIQNTHGTDENHSNPYKSAKNIDSRFCLLYNYAVFLYLPESEG